MGTPTQPIRLINQQVNPLAALQHILDILRHDVPHAIDLSTSRSERIRRRRRIIRLEQGAQLRVKRCTAIRREGGEVGAICSVGGEELAFHFHEERKGDSTALFGCCDDDEAQRRMRVGFLWLQVLGCFGGRVRDVVYE